LVEQGSGGSADRGSGGWPSISVVVPTRDRPVELERAVRAIIDQKYAGRIECIVVFDQSQPTDIAVAEREGRTVRTVTNQRTPGLAGGRNSGVLAATRDLVGFCDDDDEWLPGKLERLVALLEKHPEAALVACGVLVNFRGRDVAREAPRQPVVRRDFLRDRLMEINPCTALLRRELMLHEIGLVDEQIPGSYAEDYEWLLRATGYGPVLCVPECYVRVNWHASSFFADRWTTILDALHYLLDRYPEFGEEPRGLARIKGQIAFAESALGHRRRALSFGLQALRLHPGEIRAPVALLVATGFVSAETVLKWAHAHGRGI
jgi:glycosyltransferase involved in cell wall biosynthesis